MKTFRLIRVYRSFILFLDKTIYIILDTNLGKYKNILFSINMSCRPRISIYNIDMINYRAHKGVVYIHIIYPIGELIETDIPINRDQLSELKF